jgi:WD40 repeat protein
MDEGRPPDPPIGPEPAPLEPASQAFAPFEPATDPAPSTPPEPAATEPVNPVDVEPISPRPPSRRVIAVVGVLVVALVVFAIVGGRIVSGGPAAASPSVPRLAVTDGAGKLHTADAKGTKLADYPLKGVEFGFPTWSPDGTRIAVTGDGAGTNAVYVIDTTNPAAPPKAVYKSTDVPPFYLYWSPDGRQVAFLAQEPDKIALEVVPADGSAKASVVREGAPLYWDWLGSAHMVTHIGLTGAGSFLGEVALDGKSAEGEKLSPGDFRSPAVSRDGAYRAYVTTGKDATGVVTVESADRSKRETAPVFGSAALSFNPAGPTLAYVAAAQPIANDPGFPLGPLKAIDPATGQTRTLLDGEVLAFFWSPDGKTIAVLTLKPAGNQVVGVPGAQVASVETQPAALAYVPLTLSFVDVASGSVRAHRAFAVTSEFVNQILPYFDQYALSHRVWAPDSSAIALPGFGDGGDQLYAIPPDGSEPTPIKGAVIGFWSP